LGYSEADAIGCDGGIILTPEDREQGRSEWERQTTLTKGRAENERWHLRKDGSRFWASGLMMPLLDEAGQPQGFVNILQDRTAHHQTNQRLAVLYETTRDLLSADQPLALMHTLFNRLSTLLNLHYYYNFIVEMKDNRPMLHLNNYEGISEETAQALEWIDYGEYICGLVAQTRQQLVFNQTQLATHPNATALCTLGVTAYAGQPLIVQGKLIGILSFGSCTRTSFTPEEVDLLQSTCDQVAIALERANLTASLQRQTEQLRRANHIKDEFLAVLSHELRSPLNPILGWSRLLQTGKLDATKTQQALATIERNARLQSELIDDLLDVSGILQGKLSLAVTSVDLATTIRSAIETVRLSAEAKSIDLRFTICDFGLEENSQNLAFSTSDELSPNPKPQTPNPKFIILGDATRLQQVIWNLLSNAVKFTPAGGRVDVKLTIVDRHAHIIISDTGKGIAPDFLPHVFDYFRQEDSATTRQFGGLGLGLAIVRHLVELHGGTVYAESPGEGLGATFTVRLPLQRSTEDSGKGNTPSASATSSDRPLTDLYILIVDDDPDTRELISFLLEQAGATVRSMSSARDALIALTQSRFDVLISDIGMPDMDGYMLMRQVRSLPPEQGGQTPAIALTAYASEIDHQQAIAAGFQRHISKPVEPELLIRAIVDL
jgi:PAS domain S-box-containing protein